MPAKINKVLIVYSMLLTAVATVSIGSGVGAKSEDEKASFREIDVERINIVEADGTLRMTISNQTRFPGLIFHGEEHKHPGRKAAGILFFNEEGSETGGLIFTGRKDENGVMHSAGHLSFDQYDQDQVLALTHSQTGDNTYAGLRILDRPLEPLDLSLIDRMSAATTDEERREIKSEMAASSAFGGQSRIFVGKTKDRASSIDLRDAEGRARIRLEVKADGDASIAFLNENGEVIKSLTP